MSSEVAYADRSVAVLSFAKEHNHTVTANYGRPSSSKPASGSGEHFKGRAAAEPKILASAEKVLRSFNTWAFKREQPSDPQLMLRVIAEAMALQQPVQFVLYWGKGPRNETAAPELQCLDFLAALASRVKGVYAHGAAIKLILTDTHAELNGHSQQDIGKYFDQVKSAAARRGFDTCLLGQLVKAAGSLATVAPLEEFVSAEMVASLIASAEKWYRGGATPQEGALTYLRMNLIELRVVERAFPQSVFVTFNGSDLRSLFPRQLPIFYMYSLRRGMAVKPWFLPADPMTIDVRADQENPRPLN
jgi:hypothetical protein